MYCALPSIALAVEGIYPIFASLGYIAPEHHFIMDQISCIKPYKPGMPCEFTACIVTFISISPYQRISIIPWIYGRGGGKFPSGSMRSYAKATPVMCPINLKAVNLGVKPNTTQMVRTGLGIGNSKFITLAIGIGLLPAEIMAFPIIEGVTGHIVIIHICIIKEYLGILGQL